MPHATNTVTIAKPVETVFSFVADGETGPRGRTGIVDIRRASGEGLGARYIQGTRGPMGRRVDADYEVTAYEPNQRLEFQVTAGPVRPHGRYEFAATGDGTQITFSLDAELGGIQKLLLGGMVQRTMEAEVGALARLKQVLES